MGLTVNRQMGQKLTVNRQKRNNFTVNRRMSEPNFMARYQGCSASNIVVLHSCS